MISELYLGYHLDFIIVNSKCLNVLKIGEFITLISFPFAFLHTMGTQILGSCIRAVLLTEDRYMATPTLFWGRNQLFIFDISSFRTPLNQKLCSSLLIDISRK